MDDFAERVLFLLLGDGLVRISLRCSNGWVGV